MHPRLAREEKTIHAMIRLYCAGQHGTSPEEALCESCQELLDYAHNRLARCPFKGNKPTCANCAIHCYHRERRAQIRDVMRYSGPKMLFKYPWLSFLHLIDSFAARPSTRAGR